MKFGKSQKIKFSASDGAYSIVTPRENTDSQITVTDQEAKVLIDFFGIDNILCGNVKSDPEKARKTFKLYPSGGDVKLNLVFPKPGKNELRLYLSKKGGFKPSSHDVWFVFEKDGTLWLGNMDESKWRNDNQILIYDESEGDYQDSIQELDEIKFNELKARDVFKRDRLKALQRMEISGYKCEYDETHELFISRATSKPYLESHHLIPMSIQVISNIPLDTINNIFSLCPRCHRAIHYAEKKLSRDIIKILVSKRPEVLNILNNDLNDIFNFYAVEDIT